MACNRLRRTVFLWVDRDREQGVREPLERHLEECPVCRERAVLVEQLIVRVRTRCARRAAPSDLQERIRALLGLE